MQKVGILGAGQLGRMLLQEAYNYPVEVHVMDKDNSYPAAGLCAFFHSGDIQSYEDVVAFGSGLDVLTIEIEHVNLDALYALQDKGVRVIPSPDALKTIKNKILQKDFYSNHQIPTADYHVVQDLEGFLGLDLGFPLVQKSATGGYDGKGVQVLKSAVELEHFFEGPSVIESLVDIKKEIAVTVAIGQDGSHAIYPAVEMVFDPKLNLLDFQQCPAALDQQASLEAARLALQVAKQLGSPGLFAVEMFVDRQDKVWVNETAPRVHNSGHHTIEAHFSSQFDMLWRILLGYPLGNTEMIMPSVMVNILGAEGYSGPVDYLGLNEVLSSSDTFVHLYGKKDTKPGRKMGHVTLMGNEIGILLTKAAWVRDTLIVQSKP